jgi:ATPases with chaperone activity, ATP-binding subunit
MRLNFKNVLKNASILTVLSILTGLYVISAYFIIHTTWVYDNPGSYFRSHHEYFALANSVAYFLLFLPFSISIYNYHLDEHNDAFGSFFRSAFDFLSLNIVTDLSVFHIKDPTGLFLLTLFYVFVLSPPGILYLWTHLNPNQKTMIYNPVTSMPRQSTSNNKNNPQKTSKPVSDGKNYKPDKIYFTVDSFRQTLDQQIIGQNYAKEEIVKQLAKQVNKAKALGHGFRVFGTFFFVGPTGVGKTETAKAIYAYFKQSGYQFLRFDMGNFANPHDASTLTGSPRGYIGSDEGGALTRPLMRNNRAVILLDEMEKADPSLFRTFMTLIDEGEIQETSTGKRVTLDNAIIIFTSNLYQATIKEIITKEKDPIAAELAIKNLLSGDPTDALKYASLDLIRRETPRNSDVMTSKFPPEFIGRIDKVIPFTSLSVEDYKVIVRRLAKKYNRNVDVDAIVKKNLPIAEKYGVRQFIKKVEEDILA